MKAVISLCIFLAIGFNSFAQMSLKTFVCLIDWDATEAQFVYDFHTYIIPSEHEVWEEENSESNFSIKKILVGNHEVKKSYIRVSQKDKKLFRINLIMVDNGKDANIPKEIIDTMVNDFGQSLKIEEERSNFISLITTRMVWETYDYKIHLIYWNYLDNQQDLVISLEPYSY